MTNNDEKFKIILLLVIIGFIIKVISALFLEGTTLAFKTGLSISLTLYIIALILLFVDIKNNR